MKRDYNNHIKNVYFTEFSIPSNLQLKKRPKLRSKFFHINQQQFWIMQILTGSVQFNLHICIKEVKTETATEPKMQGNTMKHANPQASYRKQFYNNDFGSNLSEVAAVGSSKSQLSFNPYWSRGRFIVQ